MIFRVILMLKEIAGPLPRERGNWVLSDATHKSHGIQIQVTFRKCCVAFDFNQHRFVFLYMTAGQTRT